MGCSDSKAIETESNESIGRGSPARKTSKSSSGSTTLIEWLDGVLKPQNVSSTPMHQNKLPEHYLEEDITFEPIKSVDENQLNQKLSLSTKKSKNQKVTPQSQSWHYKTTGVSYKETSDTFYVEENLDSTPGKKHFVAIAGLYLGGECLQDDLIVKQLESLDIKTVHSVILLGNVFDTISGSSFYEAPIDINQVEDRLMKNEAVLAAIRKLADEEVKVYYLRGSHDLQLTRAAIERLVGDKVEYVQQSDLVIAVKQGRDVYRARFTSGKEWDLFMSSDLPLDKLLLNQPIGYYLARAASQNPRFSITGLIKPLAAGIPTELPENLLELACKNPIQTKITQSLLLSALQCTNLEDIQDVKCITSEGKFIKMQTILDYPYLKYLLDKYGHDKMMTMLKASTGDYADALKGMTEEVVIFGLSEHASIGKASAIAGRDVIYGGCGTVSMKSKQMTFIRITYPKQGINGTVELVNTGPVPSQNGVKKQDATISNKPEIQDNDAMSIENLE